MAFTDKEPIAYKDPFSHRDARFIGRLYCTPVGKLLEMDKAYLHHSLVRATLVSHWLEVDKAYYRYDLAKTKLVCRWLEGILKTTIKLTMKGK